MHITEPLPREKNSRLVFGLDWRAYAVKQRRAERRRYVDDFGASHFVEFKAGSEIIGGFCTPDLPEIKGAKLYSGAARIALHERVKGKPAVLVLLQDDQRIHLVFVVRGVVRSDEVLTTAEAHDRRLLIEQECLKLNLPLVTLGSGRSVGDVDESFTAASLLDAKKSGRIEKVPANLPSVVPLVVIGAAVVYGGIRLADMFSPPPPVTPREPPFSDRYAAQVRQTFAMKMPRANLLAPAILASFGESETVVAGWVFEKATCASKGNCVIAYRRYGGSFDDFNRAAPQAMRPVSFESNGLHLAARGPVVPDVASVSNLDAGQWPTSQGMIDLLQTPPQRLSTQPFELASYGYSVKLDPATPLLAVPPGEGSGRPRQMIKAGTWEINGYRWQVALLSRLPANMTLDSMVVELKVDDHGATTTRANATTDQVGIHFTAKGKYYVLN